MLSSGTTLAAECCCRRRCCCCRWTLYGPVFTKDNNKPSSPVGPSRRQWRDYCVRSCAFSIVDSVLPSPILPPPLNIVERSDFCFRLCTVCVVCPSPVPQIVSTPRRPQLERRDSLVVFFFFYFFLVSLFDLTSVSTISRVSSRLSPRLFFRVLCPFTPIRLIVAGHTRISIPCRVQSVEPIRVQSARSLPTIDRDSIGRQRLFLFFSPPLKIISHISIIIRAPETKVST